MAASISPIKFALIFVDIICIPVVPRYLKLGTRPSDIAY
jgi:hypothetical protein